MNSTRNGKIARLPLALREELNRRLREGEGGRTLLAWLDASPAVRAVLEAEFGGRPINGPNLTAWRREGYREWLRQQEVRAVAEKLGREATQPPSRAPGESAEGLSRWVAAQYFVALAHLDQATDQEEHWQMLHAMCGDVSQLRRDDLRTRQVEMEGQRMELLERRLENFEAINAKKSAIRPSEGN
jgi:hypothetical protein